MLKIKYTHKLSVGVAVRRILMNNTNNYEPSASRNKLELRKRLLNCVLLPTPNGF